MILPKVRNLCCTAVKMMQKRCKIYIPLCLFLLLIWDSGFSQAITVFDYELIVSEDLDEGYIRFNLTWKDSWREDYGDYSNWDAAWVFVKFWHPEKSEGSRHLFIAQGSHEHASGMEVVGGKIDENHTYDSNDNPYVGAFVFRSAANSGRSKVTFQNVKLRFDPDQDMLLRDPDVRIAVHAIEMVYVPQGAFYAGGSGSERGRFKAGGDQKGPFRVTSAWNGSIGDQEGSLWGTGKLATNTIGNPGMLSRNFPRGYGAFYSMKYQITQQQYVDFLNSLKPDQARQRYHSQSVNRYRYAITVEDGKYRTSKPYVACNWLSWTDGTAFLAWAGLRPMTELEYEKAGRGPLDPVPNEFAWGTRTIVAATGIVHAGYLHEEAKNREANAVFHNSGTSGPLRVGAFSTHNRSHVSKRSSTGAGYWGIMELSGNLWERPISVGRRQGREFSGLHGDGSLDEYGRAVVKDWPGPDAVGSGFRGGGWLSLEMDLHISDRNVAVKSSTSGGSDRGFRGVRTAP